MVAIINSLLRNDVKTTMKNDATYQAAYSDNDLLGLWACLENYFASGSTTSSDDTMLTSFYKFHQTQNMTLDQYIYKFQCRIDQLESTGNLPTTTQLRDLFIAGLNNKHYGEERNNLKSQYELFKDSQIGSSIMPATWVIAAKYFRLKSKTPRTTASTASNNNPMVLSTHPEVLPANAERYRQPYRSRSRLTRY